MTEEKTQYWTIDELVGLTETVQTAEVDHQGKIVKFQWCELVEAEEPKLNIDEKLSEEEKQILYMELGKQRSLGMIDKANEKNPEDVSITSKNWDLLPSTLKYKLQNRMLGVKTEDFLAG